MLTIKNLTFSYPRSKRKVLDDVNIDINAGGVYGLLGSNGVGKSTLLYLISGLLTPKSGKVELYGVDTRRRLPGTLSDIFIVPEIFTLPKIKLSEYVKMTSKFYPNFSEEDMKGYLDNFSMPYDVHLGRLSMGQLKKVFMSFALAANTNLLLMDEPTNGLDIPGKVSFRSIIASSMNDSRAIVISTHQVQDINLLLDHVLIMKNDGVVLNETVSRVLDKLAFNVVFKPDDLVDALYYYTTIEGTNCVKLNVDGRETQLNLETLFGLAMERTDVIMDIFKHN